VAAAVVILNRRAGPRRSAERLEALLARRLEGARIVTTNSAAEGRRAAAQAVRSGAAMVVAAGGDGTVQSVVRGLLDGGRGTAPLAILPLGRGNDLARALGYPRRWEAALDTFDDAACAPLDVGRARLDGEETIFVNALGLGFDADVARRARDLRWPGPASYAVAVVGALLRFGGPWRVRGELDGRPVDRVVTLLSLGNGSTTGGGFRITPNADPGDGWLDVCWAASASRRSIAAMLPRVALGRHGSDRRIAFARCRRLALTSTPPAPVHADGEAWSRIERIEVELLAGAVRVLRPRERS